MIWFYWGNPHMTFLRYMTLWSACAFNQDVALVTPKDPRARRGNWAEAPEFDLGENYMERLGDLPLRRYSLEDIFPGLARLQAPEVQTSDLLAWLILWQYGGTVADMDIVFTKPVPKVEHDINFVAFDGHPKPGYTPVSFLQGKPCGQWREVLRDAMRAYEPEQYESCGAAHLERLFRGAEAFHRLPSRIVFPWAEGEVPWAEWGRMTFRELHPLPPETIGIHWYAGSIEGQMYNRVISPSWLRDFPDRTISRAIRESFQ